MKATSPKLCEMDCQYCETQIGKPTRFQFYLTNAAMCPACFCINFLNYEDFFGGKYDLRPE